MDINGQFTINNRDFQLQKHVFPTIIHDTNGRVMGVEFTIHKPSCLRSSRISEFYFNLFLNDSNCNATTENYCGIYHAVNLVLIPVVKTRFLIALVCRHHSVHLYPITIFPRALIMVT